jgi:predicted small secreted protein
MKKNSLRYLALCCVLVMAMGMLAGCETCKGANRDIKALDAWMHDNLW